MNLRRRMGRGTSVHGASFPRPAVAMFDGEPDLYDCDGPEAQAEIERYYLDGYDRKPDTLAFYYLRRGEMKDHNSAEFHAEMLDREEEMHAFINKINNEKS